MVLLVSLPTDSAPTDRRALRQRLMKLREPFATGPQAERASAALARHVCAIVGALEPQCLGMYWPIRAEFNPRLALDRDSALATLPLALPFCRREPREMHYRTWNGAEPPLRDECNIPSPDGPAVVPDVVLAPCVGFTRSGYRLGYGGGYFDRWLAAHPGVTVVGVAWSTLEIDERELAPQPHDLKMTLVATEAGVIDALD